MSRIGKQIIMIPDGCTITNNNGHVEVKGPKGTLSMNLYPGLLIDIVDKTAKLSIKNPDKAKELNPIYGTNAALVKNMVIGVTTGFKKELMIVGVGYRAALSGKTLTLALGFSHPVIMEVPEGLKVDVPKPTEIIISGIDKELVGQFAALIRAKKLPEPYLGKGILYKDEKIIRKEGKAAGK